MSIGEQTAMPVVRATRRRAAPLQLAPPRRPLRSLGKIAALVALTAFAAALMAATAGIVLMMAATAMGG